MYFHYDVFFCVCVCFIIIIITFFKIIILLNNAHFEKQWHKATQGLLGKKETLKKTQIKQT